MVNQQGIVPDMRKCTSFLYRKPEVTNSSRFETTWKDELYR
jgi:hypothetical protein